MFCTKCGAEIPPGGRFCSRCGTAAPPPPRQPAQSAQAAASSVGPAVTQPVPAAPAAVASGAVFQAPFSCLVYLYGDRFVPRDTALTMGATLPCSEIKVQLKPLTEMILVTGFAWLAQDGRIALSTGHKGALMFKRNALIVTLTRRDPQSPGGLEEAILKAISGNQKADFVEDIVHRVIGISSSNPWSDVTDAAREALVPLGCFTEQRKTMLKFLKTIERTPVCDRIAALEPQVPAVQALVQSWQTGNAGVYRQLQDDVKRGIESRYEKPESDSDSDTFPSL